MSAMFYAVRLKHGDDLKKSILAFAAENNISAAAVVSGVGCVYEWRIRDASGVNIHSKSEHAEIVSLNGTLSSADCHIHISLAREDMSVFGGHLCDGCMINTTCELVLIAHNSASFKRCFDKETGYDELVID